MQLASDSQIPDGLLAAMTLLREKPRHRVTIWESAPHPGIGFRISSNAIDFHVQCSRTASDPVVAPSKLPVKFLPTNFKTCTNRQVQSFAPLGYNVEAVVKAGGFSKSAMGAEVAQFGTFDYQRGTDAAGTPTFYKGFTPVSNFNVGAYVYGTGIPQWGASVLSNIYAAIHSSNAGDPNQALYRNACYSSAASGGQITCSRFPWGQ